MLSMMIVDDEPTIRKGIISSIPWQQYEIEIAGEACNGKEALQVAARVRPQIVITDIRMPVLDGLEFARQLKKVLPKTRIVILSGYDDFNYAKQALSIGVCDYLLKPVGAEELIALLLKLKTEIIQENTKTIREESTQRLLAENLLILQSEFIHHLLKGELSEPRSIREKAAQLNIELSGPQYQVIIINIDDYLLLTENRPQPKQTELKAAVLQAAREISAAQGVKGLFCLSESDYLIGLMNADPAASFTMQDLARAIQADIRKKLNLSITVAIGRPYPDLTVTALSCSYQEAVVCLRKKFFEGKEKIICFDPQWSRQNMRAPLYPNAAEKELINQLKLMEGSRVAALIAQIFDDFSANPSDAEDLKSICIKLIIVTMNSLEEMGIDLEKRLGGNWDAHKEIAKYETIADIRQWVDGLFQLFVTIIQEAKNAKYKGIVKVAIQYIQEHYQEDINLTDIANTAFVTPNYLSRVFKEQTGESLIDWVNCFRVEQAKCLLRDFEVKIYEVAAKVGFNDYKYFSHIFKKYIGLTPKEYRDISVK